MKKGQNAEVQPPEGYVLNLQNAAVVAKENDKAVVQIYAKCLDINGEEVSALMATLRPGQTDQCQLSLVFGYDVPTEFFIKGDSKSAIVHLTGYYQPGPEDDEDMDEEDEMYAHPFEGGETEDYDDDDEMASDESSGDDEEKAALYKALAAGASGDSDDSEDSSEEGEPRVVELGDEGEDDDSDSEDERMDADFVNKMIAKNANKGSSSKGSSKANASQAPPAKKSKSADGSANAKNTSRKKGGKSGEKRKR